MYTRMNLIGTKQNKKQNITASALESFILKQMESSLTEKIYNSHGFVTAVGVRNCIYAEIFPDERMANFIAGTVHALDYYKAVPKYLVPDDCKTAVAKHTKDEIIINASYQNLENFYDVVILPPPTRKPKGKPTVEKYVQYLEK